MPIVVDDHLLVDVLAGRRPALVGSPDDEPVFTTGCWFHRLARAAGACGTGTLTRRIEELPESAQRAVRLRLDDLIQAHDNARRGPQVTTSAPSLSGSASGRPHKIRVEYQVQTGATDLQLAWNGGAGSTYSLMSAMTCRRRAVRSPSGTRS
jgi:hypothetical protein